MASPLPVHPALVHLPLGIAFLLPLLGLGLLFAIVRGWLPRRAWVIFVLVASLGLSTALMAQRSGEADERRVGALTGRQAVHEHEEAAEVFTVALGALTLLGSAAFFLRSELAFRGALGTLSLAAFVALGLGLDAGRRGGELVYLKGGCTAPPPATTP